MIMPRYWIILFLIFSPLLYSFTGKSFLAYRSQGSYHQLKDLNYNKVLRDDFYGNFSLSVSYDQSFDSHAINNYFFAGKPLVFSGSLHPSRSQCDILADYFGLPTDFKSSITFSPKIHNIIADVNFYWSLDRVTEGLFLQLSAPFAYSKWRLNPCEKVIDAGVLDHPAGYMSDVRISRSDLKQGALDVLLCGETFGDLLLPLQYGRIAKEKATTKCADITASLGYTVARKRNSFFAVNALLVVPTGTRPNAQYIFEPQVGNGHHWALGAGISGNYECEKGNHWIFSGMLDAQIQHLCRTTQKRSYDLKKSGPGSRYILLEDLSTGFALTQGFSGDIPPSPMLQEIYIRRLLYAVDATTLDSKIKVDVEANIVASFKTQYKKWSTQIGYNLWARSREKLISREKLSHKFYGVKGDAQIYSFLNIGFEIPIPINATQSQATIFKGQGSQNTPNNFINSNADNAALVYNVGAPLAQTRADSLTGTGVTALDQTNGSNQAIVLTDCDINNCSGLSPAALSNTVFGEIGYSWLEQHNRNVYCALGGQAEFASKIDNAKGAISQWNTWIKVSINY